jgi:hypothetical protein
MDPIQLRGTPPMPHQGLMLKARQQHGKGLDSVNLTPVGNLF